MRQAWLCSELLMIALFLKSQGKASSKQSGIFRHASIMFVLEQIFNMTYKYIFIQSKCFLGSCLQTLTQT